MWSVDTFLSSKLYVHFRHWKEVEVIINDFLISKRIYTFLTMKIHTTKYRQIKKLRIKEKQGENQHDLWIIFYLLNSLNTSDIVKKVERIYVIFLLLKELHIFYNEKKYVS